MFLILKLFDFVLRVLCDDSLVVVVVAAWIWWWFEGGGSVGFSGF